MSNEYLKYIINAKTISKERRREGMEEEEKGRKRKEGRNKVCSIRKKVVTVSIMEDK